jgi:hypothetical protein
MAADTAVWCGDMLVGNSRKIVRLADSRLFAGAGDRSLIARCRRWLDGKEERPASVDPHCFGALILAPDGIWRVDYRFDIYQSVGDFAVEGSHDELLIGAMAHGASAAEAVRIGIQYGCHAGGDVQIERF